MAAIAEKARIPSGIASLDDLSSFERLFRISVLVAIGLTLRMTGTYSDLFYYGERLSKKKNDPSRACRHDPTGSKHARNQFLVYLTTTKFVSGIDKQK